MTFSPRPYQQAAVEAVIEHVKKKISPCLVSAATGSGKTILIAELARFFSKVAPDKRVLCIAPSKELIEQGAEKYKAYGYPASIFCSSAGSKDLRHQVIFASPMTAIKKINTIARLGISAIIIDEAHMITPTVMSIIESVKSYDMNGKKINEKVRVIGLTATPYRMGTGYIYAVDNTQEKPIINDEDKAIEPYFNSLVYDVKAGELLQLGYLTRPVIGDAGEHYDTSSLKVDSMGNFTSKSLAMAFEGSNKTERIINKVISTSDNERRVGVMIFAATISHAEEIMTYLNGLSCAIVTGKTPKKEREKIISSFKAKRIRYLVNVSVLCTGFDSTHVDFIAILRATESPGLFQQIVGRALRLDEEKEYALIHDYAENIQRHGLGDDIFTPEIKTRIKPGEGVEIQVECPACHCITQKKRRNDPIYDGVAHDRFGNFIVPGTERATRFVDGEAVEWDGEIMTMKIQDPSRKDEFGEIEEIDLPMPAHYSRRCSNPEAYVIKGVAVACGHRFSLKICPECYAENDIAARHCTECKGRLVDPNSKLTDDAGFATVMMDGDIRRVKCYGVTYTPWVARSTGNHSLKAEYRTEIGEFTAWHTRKQKWVFNKLSQINGADPESITSYDQCADWKNAPRSLTIKKTTQGDYVRFEVKMVHFSDEVNS